MNRAITPTNRNLGTIVSRIVAALAMLAAGIAFSAPPAAAAPQKIGNGVYQDGNSYWCNGKPAALRNTHYVVGTNGDDVLLAGPDTFQVLGLDGNDTICALGPGIIISGGNGDDDIFTPDLPEGSTVVAINVVLAGAGNDHVRGGDDWDDISGGPGNDILMGGGDIDYLWGDAGWDYLNGGDSNADLCQDVGPSTGEHHSLCERFGPSDPAWSATIPVTPRFYYEPCTERQFVRPDGTIVFNSECGGYSYFR